MKESALRRNIVGLWADLARAGNFPSVASNVLAALVLSGGVAAWPAGELLALAVAAGWLAYAGGATLNDVVDCEFDARNRPGRPIPSGRVRRSVAGVLGGAELAAGAALLVWAGATGAVVGGLVGVILAYDVLHKRWAGSVVLMAGCRVLLALAVATLPGHEWTGALVLWLTGLFLYIVGISLLARWEYRPGAPAARLGQWVGRLLAMMPLIDAVALACVQAWGPALACAAAYPVGRWAQRLAAST